jgi:hypothetical protein
LEQNITSGAGNGPSIRWLSIVPVSDGTVYLAATSTGLYATDTLMGTGTIWVRQGDNTIGAVVCDMIDYRQSDGTVILATHANGIYSATITSVNDIVTVPEVEQSLTLGMNVYPNPATDVVNIKYTLSKSSKVEIVLLDELGRMVRAAQTGQMGAGEQSTELNISDLNPGVYYVRLLAGEAVETKGLIVQ